MYSRKLSIALSVTGNLVTMTYVQHLDSTDKAALHLDSSMMPAQNNPDEMKIPIFVNTGEASDGAIEIGSNFLLFFQCYVSEHIGN